MSRWSASDVRRAARQGWLIASTLYMGRPSAALQRIDDPAAAGIKQPYNIPRFKNDEQVEGYVRGRADAGCALARKALRVTDHYFRQIGRVSNWNNVGPSRTTP